jgi:predicted AlkP superfamily phosphohydrolase/phosphomutase
MKELNRRDFLRLSLAGGTLLALKDNSKLMTKVFGKRDTAKKMIVLGLDGLDPYLLQSMIEQGNLPYFKQLRDRGDFHSLRTSIPPQSPVAWANFITGTNPGGHAIFDFIHRHPNNYIPYLSTSETTPAKHKINIGKYVFPLSSGEVKLLRKGKAFWQILEEYDIPATIFKMPSNYPPAETKQRTLSGMGTPDILGTYGIFSYYTTKPAELKEDIGGGKIYQVYVENNKVEAQLIGPKNIFKKEEPESVIDFKVYCDRKSNVAKIVIQGNEFILQQGEWSRWIRIDFKMIPTQRISGICQFYLKEVSPHFKLYVTPININPQDPALPICTPSSYSKELYNKFGYFYTKGLPADTKALDHGVFDDGEFLQQDEVILQERMKMFDYELNRFDSGLIFYYVSSTDQRQHMFWRLIDKEHPNYDSKLAFKYGNTIKNIYIEMDELLAKALKKVDKNTILIVMSDHGFMPFRRSFNLNTWLKENGYISLNNERWQGESEFFLNVDWSNTRAYALGLNGLYINQAGREGRGIVPASKKESLIYEIARKLEEIKDPETGEKAIYKAYITKEVYQGSYVNEAPEIIIGYNRNYRASWATPLGRIPKNMFEDNKAKWSGDHCMAQELLSGILLANRKIKINNPALYDVTATILKTFGIHQPKEMIGRPIF